MSSKSELLGGFFEEAPDIDQIVESLNGRVCDAAGNIQMKFDVDVDGDDRIAHAILSFINSGQERYSLI